MRGRLGYGVPRNLFAEVTVPVPLTVQPMAMLAETAVPPSRVPRQKLAVPVTCKPTVPLVLFPLQFVALAFAKSPTPDVLVPEQFVALAPAPKPVPEALVPEQLLALVEFSPVPVPLTPVLLEMEIPEIPAPSTPTPWHPSTTDPPNTAVALPTTVRPKQFTATSPNTAVPPADSTAQSRINAARIPTPAQTLIQQRSTTKLGTEFELRLIPSCPMPAMRKSEK